MDLSDTIAPNSDQLDAVDLLTGPKTFTITKVTKNNGEQPVNIHLAEFDRPWRPGKSMRRVLVSIWGADASHYVGRRLTLWCDPTVRFGGAEVGGVRITHLSDMDKPRSVPLLVTRGKSAPFMVRPLAETQPPARQASSRPSTTSPVVSADLLAELAAMFERKGIPVDNRLSGVNRITGGSATDLEVITEAEARQVLAALAGRPDAPVPAKEQPTENGAWPETAEVKP